jgi:hypothetical protein
LLRQDQQDPEHPLGLVNLPYPADLEDLQDLYRPPHQKLQQDRWDPQGQTDLERQQGLEYQQVREVPCLHPPKNLEDLSYLQP